MFQILFMLLMNKVDCGLWKKKTLLKVIVPQLFPVESRTDSAGNKKTKKNIWQLLAAENAC